MIGIAETLSTIARIVMLNEVKHDSVVQGVALKLRKSEQSPGMNNVGGSAASSDPMALVDERAILATVTLATMLAPLNSTMIAVALPRIAAEFGGGAIGMGLGLSSAGLQTSAVESVEAREAGVASGVFSTSRYLGSIVGSSVLAGLIGAGRLETAFMMIVVVAVAAVVVGLGLRDWPVEERTELR